MRIFLLIILFSSVLCSAKGQVFEIGKDFEYSRDFPLSYYIDTLKGTNFEAMRRQKFEKGKAHQNLGFINYPVWVHINLRNQSKKKRFLLKITNVDSLEVWQAHTGNWQKIVTGNQFPFVTRPIDYRNLLFEIPFFATDTAKLYVCIKGVVQVRLEMELWEADAFYAYDSKDTLFYGVFYGMIILMVIYNALIWVRLREITYLYYVFFASFLLMLQLSIYEFSYQYLFGNIPFLNNSGIYIWLGSLNFCSANFARHFLDVAKYSPRWSKILFGVSFYGILVIILSFFLNFSQMTALVFSLNPLYTTFLVVVGLVFWRKGSRFAPFFSLAWLAYIVGLITMVLYNKSIIPYSFWVEHSVQISTIVEIVVLSLAMSYKHKILDQEAQKNLLEVQKLRFEQTIQEEEKLHLEQTLLQKEKIYSLEQEKMQMSLHAKERELTAMMIQISEKNQVIDNIQKKLGQIGENSIDSKNLKALSKSLQENLDLDGDWQKFCLHFEQVHPDFFNRLSTDFASLSANDLKVAAYLRISLGTKEIARLLNIDVKSVKMTKYRLKRKLSLSEEQDLEVFLRQF